MGQQTLIMSFTATAQYARAPALIFEMSCYKKRVQPPTREMYENFVKSAIKWGQIVRPQEEKIVMTVSDHRYDLNVSQ